MPSASGPSGTRWRRPAGGALPAPVDAASASGPAAVSWLGLFAAGELAAPAREAVARSGAVAPDAFGVRLAVPAGSCGPERPVAMLVGPAVDGPAGPAAREAAQAERNPAPSMARRSLRLTVPTPSPSPPGPSSAGRRAALPGPAP